MPDLPRWIVRAASRLAPRARRRDFRAEWEAELATDPSLSRALGALADAWFLRRQPWTADMILQDVRYACRLMAQRPGFTAAVVLTLTLGIGANTAVFTVVNAVLLRPLPFGEPDRLMALWENDRLNGKPRYFAAPANFKDWQDQTRAFEQLAAFRTESANFAADGDATRVPGAVVTANFFETLAVRPLLGDGFTPQHGEIGQHRVLVLSYDIWQRHFHGDAAIVGRQIDLGLPQPYRVLGVMPRTFRYPERETGYWRALAMHPQTLANRSLHFLSVVGRRRPGVTPEQAQTDMNEIARRQQAAYPTTNDQRGVTLVPLMEQIVGDVRKPLYTLAAAVFMVLLIGCANVGNLLLIRAASRRRELALRSVLGADRLRIVRQLFVEGLALAGAGAAAGLLLAVWATALLRQLASAYVPRIADAAVDGRVLAFVAAISVMASSLFALTPALTSGARDIRDALHANTAASAGAGRAVRRLRGALAIAELAMACVLVLGAGLVLKSFWRLLQVSPGFATERILSARIELPQSRYPDGPQIMLFYETLFERLRQVPGVEAAGGTNALPLEASGPTTWLTIEGQPRPQGEPPEVNYRTASIDYFRALDVPVLAGRSFTSEDTATSLVTAVVNRTLADRFFNGRDPIGQRIRIGPNPKGAWRTIVGVVGDMRQSGPEAPVQPELYLPIAQDTYAFLTLAIRTQAEPMTLAATLRDVVHSIDPKLAVIDATTMERILSEHVASRRLLMVLLAVFAGVALMLALIGIYGVMGSAVSQRTNEIGVRMALGAERGEIMMMILRDGARLGVAGLALGLAVSLAGTRLIASSLFGVTPTDAPTYAVVVALMLVVALFACYLPARRAARVDPLSAIRAE